MTRALLSCTIVLTLGLIAHAQGFDPLYKPKPGDEAIIARPILLAPHLGMGMTLKPIFVYDIGPESPDAFTDLGKLNGSNLEESQTSILPQQKIYHLRAGTKVKVIAKTKTMSTIFNAQLLRIPIYEVEITEDGLAGTHVYISGISLQMKADHAQAAWTDHDLSMHNALVMEDDNPSFAIEQYRYLCMVTNAGRIVALAKDKLTAAGITPPEQFRSPDKDDSEPAPVIPATPRASGFGKPLAAPKEESEDLTVDLLDSSWEHSDTGNYIYIYVKIRYTSGTTLKVLRVTATLEQQNNSIVSTAKDFMEPMTIAPKGTALAKLSCKANPLIHHYNLTFENADFKEVKFKNRTK